MQGIGPALPFEPLAARVLGVEVVLDLEAHAARELLCPFADQQVMVGEIHHHLRHPGRRAHPFDFRDATGALLRPVHAAGVELHHSVGVRQTTVADTVVGRIELDDVDAGDQRVEDVGAADHLRERGLDAGLRAAVLELVAVAGRDDDRLDALGRHHGRGLTE